MTQAERERAWEKMRNEAYRMIDSGMTQKEVAKALGTNQTRISVWMSRREKKRKSEVRLINYPLDFRIEFWEDWSKTVNPIRKVLGMPLIPEKWEDRNEQ